MRRVALLLAAAAVALFALRPAGALPLGPPSASMTWSPGTPTPSVPVTFTIDAFDPDGPLTSGSLEYGDGTKESFLFTRSTTRDAAACVTGDGQRAVLRHVYTGRGDYPVKLTVEAGSCPGANLVVAGRVVATYMVSVGAPNTKPPAAE